MYSLLNCMHAFLCTADCGSLQNPANGQVILNETVFKSIANYSCNSLYSIVGDTSRVCQANGTWSGSVPTCQGILIVLIRVFPTQLYACTFV